jgi:hypothetical protein
VLLPCSALFKLFFGGKKLIANVEQNLDHELDVPFPQKKNQD